MMVNDWNAEAVSMANYVYEHMFEAHRGAMPWKQDGITVVFGNDGYSSDKRARNAVKMLRKFLDSRETPVLGFGVDSEAGHSWAMSVKTADDEVLNDGEVLNSLIWMFFNGHSDMDAFTERQFAIAWEAITEHGTRPETSVN
jgi:hypothetical protein